PGPRGASPPAPRGRSAPRGGRAPRLRAGARARGAAAARRLRRGSAWRWAGASPLTYRSLARRERRPYVPAMTEVLKDDLARRFATRAVHAGQIPDPLAGAVMTPIYQTSPYVQDGLGRHKGYEYARTRNPTPEALERNVAAA